MVLLLLLVGLIAVSAATKPHIVHIMLDDTGRADINNPLVEAPIMQRLMTEGLQFSNHYVFRVCSPSRAALQSGRYPWSLGLYDNDDRAYPNMSINATGDSLAIPLQYKLLPERLTELGYEAHAVGKWHCGFGEMAYTPTFRGYKTFLGYYKAMTMDYWSHKADVSCGQGGIKDMADSYHQAIRPSNDNMTYDADLFGDRVVDIIHQHNVANPLFVYFALHNEHDPHQAPKWAIDRFEHVPDDTYKVTAAMIYTMDQQIQRVVDALNETGMLNNTILTITSDNGGPLDHALNYNSFTGNGRFLFRGGKHTLWEGGVNSIAWMWSPLLPEAVRGTYYDGLVHISDFARTYVEGVAGGSFDQEPGTYNVTSFNLWPSIVNQTPSPRDEVIIAVTNQHAPANCTASLWATRACTSAIRKKDMKLILGSAGDPRIIPVNASSPSPVPFGLGSGKCDGEHCSAGGYHGPHGITPETAPCLHGCLFNLTEDPSEAHNLYADPEYAEVVTELTRRVLDVGATGPRWAVIPEMAVQKDWTHELCAQGRANGATLTPLDW
eukprot:TRINITY_DN5363_c0_g1_i1.p1 TRINITY_DN5363_c0_g1~~TRINITY_DN5363_c0_g1_i1.p1  ORF type:complete len:551 (+),score=101.88 TRINITY_DN5363_c0_g1_i1:3-1655(+)